MKIIIAFFLLFLSYNQLNAFAIPSEGTVFPKQGKVAVGSQSNIIFNRDFNKVEGNAGTQNYFATVRYGLAERFSLDGKIGWGAVRFKPLNQAKLDFPLNFAGGYGWRYLIYDDPKVRIKTTFGFQHISVHPHKEEIDGVRHRIIWDEWQATALFVKGWRKFFFYAGPQYSVCQLKYVVGEFRRRIKTEDSWGAVFGTDYNFDKDSSVNIEFRAFVEHALNIGIEHRF